jgi:hypothetical protein
MAERSVYSRLVGIGSMTMPDYRVYLLDSDDHIRKGSDLRSETDDQALMAAKSEIPEGVQAEVWQGTRRIAVIGKRFAASG